MGTRADFYVGKNEMIMIWIASVAFDGYPAGVDKAVLEAKSKDDYLEALHEYFKGRDDVTYADDGWPWPWLDSSTTDYAYTYDEGKVWGCCFGHEWFDVAQPEPEPEDCEAKTVNFPNMKDIQIVKLGKRSGLIVIKRNSKGELEVHG